MEETLAERLKRSPITTSDGTKYFEKYAFPQTERDWQFHAFCCNKIAGLIYQQGGYGQNEDYQIAIGKVNRWWSELFIGFELFDDGKVPLSEEYLERLCGRAVYNVFQKHIVGELPPH